MGVLISVETNLGPLQAYLNTLAKEVGKPRRLLEIAGSVLEESTRERFATSRGPGGIPWPVTGRQRAGAVPRKGARGANRFGPKKGGKPLVDKGNLLASITHVTEETRVHIGVQAKSTSGKFSYVHQFGATILPKKGPYLVFTGSDGTKVFAKQVVIPPRPFLGVDEADRVELRERWTAYLGSLKDGA